MTEKIVEPSTLQTSAYLSPYRIVLIFGVTVFISEVIIMMLISFLAPGPALYEALIDSSMLVALLSPAFYFFLFKPMLSDIRERRLVEECVRKNEARNRSILESIPEMLFILDKDGVFIGFKAMKGMETLMLPEDFIGKKASDVLPARLAEETLKHIKLALATETAQLFEYELPLKGILHNYEAKIARISVDEALCIVRDITERKQAEKALKDSEAKFRTIFEGGAIGMALSEFNGQSITSNPALKRMLGFGSERLTLDLISELTHPDDRETDLKLFNEMISGKRDGYQIEKRYIRKDGIMVFGQLTISLVRRDDKEPRFIVCMLEDITERKGIEKALQESEEKYRRIVETAHEGIWMLDTSVKTSYVNFWMAQMLGYTTEEMLGRHLFDFMDAQARIEAEKYLGRLKQGIKDTIDFRFSMKDGTDMWAIVSTNPIFDEKGQYVGALGMMTDISQRKQVELEREQFFKFFQISSDLMVIADPNGCFKRVNPACLQMLGYSETELLEKPFIDFVHPDDRQSTLEEMARQIQLGFSLNFENRYICKYGIVIWLSWRANYNKDEGITYATARDITQSKLAGEIIKKSLEEKEVLLREIHHRVKNNMQVISSLLTLQSQNIEEKKFKDIFIESQTRIFSMALIHEKLYQSESLAQINFKEYIEGIVSNIFESYCIKSNIKIDINAENIPIKIDYAVPCGLIINELITNAIKYAFPAGKQGKIQILLKSIDNNMIQLSISDDGIGIAKDMDIRNTKSLGLHLVTALAEGQLHGKIILNRDRGTEFQITFGAK